VPSKPQSARKDKPAKPADKAEEKKEAVAAPPSADKSTSVKRDVSSKGTTSGTRPTEQA